MEDFKPSPFDQLIIDLEQLSIKQAMITLESGNPQYRILTPLGQFVYQQARLLRVVFINYSLLSYRGFGKSGTMTNEEMICMSDQRIKVSFDYFSFINQLNQLGRRLKKDGSEIPNFVEIRFFRNKIMEHWDDYLNTQLGSGATGAANKLPIPIMLCKNIELEAHERAKADLIGGLKAHDPMFSLDGIHCQDPGYAESVFRVLKRVDVGLRSEPEGAKRKKKEKFIPDQLVELLFAYEFPLPIYNIEDYCVGLVLLLQGLKLTV